MHRTNKHTCSSTCSNEIRFSITIVDFFLYACTCERVFEQKAWSFFRVFQHKSVCIWYLLSKIARFYWKLCGTELQSLHLFFCEKIINWICWRTCNDAGITFHKNHSIRNDWSICAHMHFHRSTDWVALHCIEPKMPL